MSSPEVKTLSKECEEKMMEIFETDTDQYRQLLEFYSKIFHQNHFQVFRNKFRNFVAKKILIDVDIIAEKIPGQKFKGKINTRRN